MEMKKVTKVLSLLILVAFVFSVAIAQESKDSSTSAIDESKRNPDGTYSSEKFDEAQRP